MLSWEKIWKKAEEVDWHHLQELECNLRNCKDDVPYRRNFTGLPTAGPAPEPLDVGVWSMQATHFLRIIRSHSLASWLFSAEASLFSIADSASARYESCLVHLQDDRQPVQRLPTREEKSRNQRQSVVLPRRLHLRILLKVLHSM